MRKSQVAHSPTQSFSQLVAAILFPLAVRGTTVHTETIYRDCEHERSQRAGYGKKRNERKRRTTRRGKKRVVLEPWPVIFGEAKSQLSKAKACLRRTGTFWPRPQSRTQKKIPTTPANHDEKNTTTITRPLPGRTPRGDTNNPDAKGRNHGRTRPTGSRKENPIFTQNLTTT